MVDLLHGDEQLESFTEHFAVIVNHITFGKDPRLVDEIVVLGNLCRVASSTQLQILGIHSFSW